MEVTLTAAVMNTDTLVSGQITAACHTLNPGNVHLHTEKREGEQQTGGGGGADSRMSNRERRQRSSSRQEVEEQKAEEEA